MVVCESRDRTSSTLFPRNTSRSGRASCCCASARTLAENPSSRIFLLMFLLLFVSWCVLLTMYHRAHVSGFGASVSTHIWLRFQPIYQQEKAKHGLT